MTNRETRACRDRRGADADRSPAQGVRGGPRAGHRQEAQSEVPRDCREARFPVPEHGEQARKGPGPERLPRASERLRVGGGPGGGYEWAAVGFLRSWAPAVPIPGGKVPCMRVGWRAEGMLTTDDTVLVKIQNVRDYYMEHWKEHSWDKIRSFTCVKLPFPKILFAYDHDFVHPENHTVTVRHVNVGVKRCGLREFLLEASADKVDLGDTIHDIHTLKPD